MKVYNTLTRTKEELKPLDGKEYKIYVCGPTVYNYFHIGNARPFVVFDTLRRYLEYRGNKVKYVQNFTDVDDKIINKAREEGVPPSEISEKYIDEYYKDAKSLGVKPASVHPKVTENMDEIIDLVATLVEKGHAYEMDGDVYFDTASFPSYGSLSSQNTEDLEAGARINIDERKKSPLDFALWKRRKTDDELAWESPWGMGRPGWHIECSAMSRKYLGDTIDIHAGGQDLTFPHHENEIAQSEAASGKKFAEYWMHNGYITIDDKKMSKSEGNFFTVRDILKEYSGETVRFFLLAGHYRSPIDFSRTLMDQSKSALDRIHNAAGTLSHLSAKGGDKITAEERDSLDSLSSHRDKFISAMDDDLNTADAIAAIFELIAEANNITRNGASKEYAAQTLSLLRELTDVLGFTGIAEVASNSREGDAELQQLLADREAARAQKDWARADEIRDILKERGITLKDTPQGVQILYDEK